MLNPGVHTFALSCATGEGISTWVDWVVSQICSAKSMPEAVAGLRVWVKGTSRGLAFGRSSIRWRSNTP